MRPRGFIKGMVLGTLAGVVGGILFAPKSGEKTREDLTRNFNEIKGKVVNKLEEVENFSKDMYDKVVKEVVSGYETAKRITPDDASKINDIFERSFRDIEKILKKDVRKISKDDEYFG